MSAGVLTLRVEARPLPALRLAAPFAQLSPAQLARHFAARGNGHFFPVADPEETRRSRIDDILRGRFAFNGEAHDLGAHPDWLLNPSADVEWHILLHKFYYAVGLAMAWQESGDARYLRRWMDLTAGWIAQVPPGWIAADVAGRRVQNWIYALHTFCTALESVEDGADFCRTLLASLQEQVEFLVDNLTPARNHRTLELYAIFLAGVAFPEFADAARWREFALAEIALNVQSDLLPDGVQCELSTDYHHLVLKNYLCVRRLARLNGIEVPAAMDERLVQALEFSMHAHKPDGIVPSLSDGDARSYLDLLRQGAELYGREDFLFVASGGCEGRAPRKRAQGFTDSGYYILRSGWGGSARAFRDEHYLIFDCGPLGAGNHGHLDCLSFELAANGASVVVDPGRYTYSEAGETNWRVRFRGSAYHNTVTVDGRNQTAYQPKAVKPGTRHKAGSVRHRISGPAPEHRLHDFVAQDGFALLRGRARSHEYDVLHERCILFAFSEYWLVHDVLQAPEPHRYDSWLHLSERAQGAAALSTRRGTRLITAPGLAIAAEDRGELDIALEQGFVSYRYGEKLEAPVVRASQSAAHARFTALLYPHALAEAPLLTLRELPLQRLHGREATACAVRIQVGEGPGSCTDTLFFAEHGEATWQFGAFRFAGRFLALRKDAAGDIVELHCDRGARLEREGRRVVWQGLAA